MKLLYTVIFLLMGLVKMVVTKPLNNTNHSNTAAEQLVKFYSTEYDLLAEEICVKIKNISEEILENEIVQHTATPLMQELKKNMTHFQPLYKFFKRFGANTTLVLEFSDMLQCFYHPPQKYENDKDFLYIKQLLTKLGYSELRDKYKQEFKKFLTHKFLAKVEEFNSHINQQRKRTENDLKVLQWIDLLKECQDYECFLIDFETYSRKTASFLNRFFGEIFEAIFKGIIINTQNVTVFANDVLKDEKLSQLSAPIRQQLSKNLQDIIKILDSDYEMPLLLLLHPLTYFVLYRFNNYTSITSKESQLISHIFQDHGYESLYLGPQQQKEDDITKRDYIKEYEEQHIAGQSPYQLQEQRKLLEAIERLTNSTTAQERNEAWQIIAFSNVLNTR